MPIDDLDGEVMITMVQGARWVHCKGRGQGRTHSQAPRPRPCQHLLLQWIPYNLRVQERILTEIFPVCNQGSIEKKGLNKQVGFPSGSAVKDLPANAGNVGSIPGLGRSPGGGNGNPPQYSCLKNSMDRGKLVGCNPGGCKESDMIYGLNNN